MPRKSLFSMETLPSDLKAGLVVFLVALPLCLGVAHASGAPLFSGVLAGILGGLVVGFISRSHTSVSGPSAAIPALVVSQLEVLGSFDAFLLAVVIAGALQLAVGLAKMGSIGGFFPSCVINGLLVAIGIKLILTQLPHVVGHDPVPEGYMAFFQPNQHNTLSEFLYILDDFNLPSAGIGLASIAVLMFWDRSRRLKNSLVPGPLAVVALGIGASALFNWIAERQGEIWRIEPTHLVQVPLATSLRDFLGLINLPDFTAITQSSVWIAAITVAAVLSLETLLNLEAVDNIDPYRRHSPPNRELVAQGIGNLAAGLIGAIPISSVIVRSSVNINAGGRTRLATMFHGILILGCVALLPTLLNLIPLSCLAAILIVTGLKLASPATAMRMWKGGWNQFLPFAVTVVAIIFTDLLIGILIGLFASIGFILRSTLRRPLYRIREKHLGGEVLRIKLASQVGFFNKAALAQAFDDAPPNSHLLLDAHNTDYIDSDVLDLIHDFKDKTAPARGIQVSLRGFKERYRMKDQIAYIDYSTRELQETATPLQILQILKEGNERFMNGTPLHRNFSRAVGATAHGQYPLAAIVSCIDSRTPAELVFDLGLGDIFSIRIAGNVTKEKVLGSLEYACAVAGSKLILVMGHTRCGAVNTAVRLRLEGKTAAEVTGCTHIDLLLNEIQKSMVGMPNVPAVLPPHGLEAIADEVMRRNVQRTVEVIRQRSEVLGRLEREGKIAIVGAAYDVATGQIEFFPQGTPKLLDESAVPAVPTLADA